MVLRKVIRMNTFKKSLNPIQKWNRTYFFLQKFDVSIIHFLREVFICLFQEWLHVMAKKVSFNPNVAYFVTMLLQWKLFLRTKEVKGHVHPPFKEERSACFRRMMDLPQFVYFTTKNINFIWRLFWLIYNCT